MLEAPSPITVDGNDGYTYTTRNIATGLADKSAVFVHGNNIFELVVIGQEGSDSEPYFNHMLESIDFT